MAATLGLALAFTGLTVATAAAPALADGAGQPFSCSPPTFFALSEDPVGTAQLYKGSYAANGTAAFTALGGAKTGASLYNALAYNPQDGYLYGTAYGTASNTGHLMRIDSAGNATDLGAENPALGTPPDTLWDSGEFDAAGNYYVMDGNAGTKKIYKIAGASAAPATKPTVTTITLSSSITAADFSFADGFLWAHGYGNSNFYRINSTTGAVSTFSSTVIPALDYGSEFTMGNGNLAFISTTGVLEQVAVANPTATPTFSLVSTATAPANSRSDATNCVSRPTDLSITKTGTPAVLVNGTITWTLDVHNAGPGVSTGFVVNDTLPTTVPITSAPTATSASAGCTVTGRAIACNGASLAVGADAVITVTAKASPTSLADVVNTATVTANEQDLVATNNSSTFTTAVGPQPIAAVADAATTASGTAVAINVLANDTYTGGGVNSVTTPAHGSASVNADGTVEYTPAAAFSGTDSFSYTLKDAEGQTKTATATVTVTPVAVNDTATTPVNTTVDVNVLGNDQGASLTLSAVSAATHGTVSIVAGKARFVPTPGYSGIGTFSYTIVGTGGTDTATATVAITPTAGNDSVSTTAGVAVADTTALSNDIGTGLTVTAVSNGASGTASIVSGAPVYTPAAGFSGTDTFTYTVTDGSGQTATGSITVTVAPTAVNDSASTPANTAVSVPVLTNDLGKSLSVSSVTQPAHGSVAIVAGLPVYTPAGGFSGTDTFTYTVTGAGGTSTATVAMTVNPVAVTDTATVEAGDPVTINALSNDLGTGLSITSVTNGAHGSVAIVGGKIVYDSTAGYSGADSFTYTIIDGSNHTSTATETVTVTPDPSGVNDVATTVAGNPVTVDVVANDNGTGLTLSSATNGSNGTVAIVGGKAVYTPTGNFSGTDTFTYLAKDADNHSYGASVTVKVAPKAQDDAATTAAGNPVTIDAAANDLGASLTVTAVTNGAHGTVVISGGKPVYTPAAGFSGADTFSYTVTDGSHQTSTATVAISVTPVAVGDTATTNAGAAVTVSVLANDLGTGDAVQSVTQPSHGSVVLTGGLPVYTPATGFSGVDSFTYTIKDSAGTVSTATVTVTVKPVAMADVTSTPAGTADSVAVLGNDIGKNLTVTGVTAASHGTVVIAGGVPVYTPAAGFSGADSFSYTLSGDGGSATTTVAVQVTPVAVGDAATTAANTAVDVAVVSNDVGSSLALTSVSSAVNGTVAVVAGKAHFVPTIGFSGIASFSYLVTDVSGQTSTATATVTVSPVAVNDAASTVTGTARAVDVLSNDLGVAISVTSITQPSHGSVVVTGGKPVYTPVTGFSGTDTFSYTITGAGGSSTATITMTIAPLAVTDSASTEVGDSVSVGVLANDIGSSLSVTGVSNGAHGTVAIVSGLPVYIPAAAYVGTDSFTYTITGAGGTSTATVNVTVNAGPSGANDVATTPAATPVSIAVLGNDSGSGLTLSSVANGANGTVAISGSNAVYTPASGFSGSDTFGYTGKDAAGHTYTASVTVTVTPVAHADSATTTAGTAVDVNVVSNDSGSGLTLTSVGSAANGSVAIVGGVAEFTPATGFSGAASFGYTVTDASGQIATATVAISVGPKAVNDAKNTNANTAVTIDALANDLGSNLAISTVSSGAHGTAGIAGGKIVYTPASGFSGVDSLSYTISATGGTSTASIAITVLPTAVADTAANVSGDPVTVNVLANDLGTSLSVVSATGGSHGTVTIVGGEPVYTPTPGYLGTDTFTYLMQDAAGNTSSATVTVTVQAAPTAKNDAASTSANTAVSIPVLANDSGTGLALATATNGSNGTVAVSGSNAVYTPAAGFSGTDSFTYTAKDSTGHVVSATVTVTVTPVALADTAVTVAGTAVDINVVANDAGTGLSLSSVSTPVGGTIAIVGGKAEFTPAAGFSGAASFGYVATDASGQTTTSTVGVTVTPKAVEDGAATPAATPVSVSVLGNDLGTGKTISSITNGANGTVAISGNQVVYTPASNFSGTDSFTYTITDSSNRTSTAPVTVLVTPVATNDSGASVSGDPTTVDVLANDLGSSLAVQSVTQPNHGVVVVTNGKPVYTPAAGYTGADSFGYTLVDGAGSTASATVGMTVTAAPTAANDTATTSAGTAVSVPVLANDSGTGLTLFSAANGSNGAAAISGSRIVYTPASGFSGTDLFTYVAKDSTGHAVSAIVTITVTPVATADVASTTAGTPIDINVIANDKGSLLSLTSVASALNGTVAIVGGKAEFTPSVGFSGAASFSYLVTDASGQTATTTVAVTVAPKAIADVKSTSANTAVTIDALANDLGSNLALATVSNGAHGSAVITAGKIVYTPSTGFSGTDSLTYSISGSGGPASATIAITVLPTAVADAAANVSGDPVTVDVLANDLGTGTALISVTQPSHGSVVVTNGKAVYTPSAGYAGTDTFTYLMADGAGNTSSATVTITVQAAPTAANDAATTSANTAATVDVLANDHGTVLALTSVTQGANGSVAIVAGKVVYTPNPNFSGTDAFTYTAKDSTLHPVTATVTVTVTPVATTDTATTPAGTAIDIPVTSNDAGSGLSLTAVSSAVNGSVAIVAGKVEFTPAAGFSGTATFSYTAADGSGQTTNSTVTVTVTPVANADAASTNANTPVSISVLTNDLGFAKALSSVTNGSNGTVAVSGNTAVYTPAANFSGADTFSYTVSAAGGTSTATVTVTVKPVAVNDSAVSVSDDPVVVDVTANDHGSALVVLSATQPSHGSVVVTNGMVVYTPTSGYAGTDAFTYTVADALGDMSTATVTVTSTAAPTATNDAATTAAGAPVTVDVLANDTGTAMSLFSVVQGAHGSVVIVGGKAVYAPATGFSGTDAFTYVAKDSTGHAVTAEVTITVTPVAHNDAASTPAGSAVDIAVLGNDLGSALTLTSVASPTAGTVAIVNGEAEFTPAAGFSGAASFGYTATDSSNQSAQATVSVSVTPKAASDAKNTPANTPVTIDVLANDLGSGLALSTVSNGIHGTAAIASGKIVYTPTSGFSGADSLNYTVTGSGGTSGAAVAITVLPTAVDDSAANISGDPVTINVLANDIGTSLAVVSTTNGSHGVVTLVNGTPVYTPVAGYAGTDSFSYLMQDGNGNTSAATVTVTVQRAPTATNDAATTAANTPVSVAVLGNDHGTALSLATVSGGSNGSAAISGSTVVYTPNAGFSGTDSFTYVAKDSTGHAVSATVTITVTPVSTNDAASTPADTAVSIDVLGNDTGSALALASVGSAVNGTVAIVGGKAEFTPTAGFSGAASFSYVADDGSHQATTATVAVTVTPKALADSINTDAATSVTIAAIGNDLGSNLAVTGVTNGANGTVSIVSGDPVYTPNAGFSGTDSFTYAIAGDGGTSTATVTVIVTPVAVDDSTQVVSGDTVTIDALANDLGSSLQITGVTAAGGGTVAVVDGELTYVSNPGFSGPDSFNYTLTDGAGNTAQASVDVAVTAGPSGTNDAASTVAGVAKAIAVLANDSGTGLSLTGVGAASNGSTAISGGRVVYTPNVGFSGTDTFTYSGKDATNHPISATVTVTVSPRAIDDAATTTAGAPEAVAVLGNDLGSNLVVTTATNGAHGTVSIVSGGPVYTPAAGFSGTDSFSYTVVGDGGTSTAHVTVTVGPKAFADSATTTAGSSTSVDVAANDLGTGLTVTSVSAPAHGTVAIAGGTPVYTPGTGYSGPDSFTYTITGDGGTSTAVVSVDVTPVAVGDTAATTANTAVSVSTLANDSGDGLTVTAVTNGANGAVSIVSGAAVYTPVTGFSGQDSFTYTATDKFGQSVAATVTVTVAPVAVNDSTTTPASTAVNLDVLANDAGSSLAISGVTAASHGTALAQPDGTITYTPNAGFSGTDTFSYTATDGASIATATVTVDVTPVAIPDLTSTVAGGAVTLSPLVNDLGLQLTVSAVTNGANGVVVVRPGNAVQYKPAAGFSGSDSFSYTITDKTGQTATTTVSVTVMPTAVDDEVQTASATPVTIDALANDLGTGLSLTSVGTATSGTAALVNGRVVYTPSAGFSGTDTFSYLITDADLQTASGTITVLVTPVAPDDAATTAADTPLTIDVLANDVGTGLTLTSLSAPTSGTATIVDNAVYFVPAAGSSGKVTFTYTSTDASNDTATATVTVWVTPIAVNIHSKTVTGVAVHANPTPDNTGTGLWISHVGTPTDGTAVIALNGSVVYTPTAGFSGTDQVSYTTTDSTGQTSTAMLMMTVAPLANADSRSTRFGTAVSIPVLANDLGTSLVVTAHTNPTHGTVTFAPSGVAVYEPKTGFSGSDSFAYTATDASGQSVSTTVIIQVDPAAVTRGASFRGHGLAFTGSDPAPLIYFAMLLMVVGIAVWIIGRRRRRRDEA